MDRSFRRVFERSYDQRMKKFTAMSIAFVFAIFLFFWTLILTSNNAPNSNGILALIVIGIGAWIFAYSISKKNSDTFWISLMRKTPEKMVYCKPIVLHTSYGFVITISKEFKLKLHTNEGKEIQLDFISVNEAERFLNTLKEISPNAHYGYDFTVDALYHNEPEYFLSVIQSSEDYIPLKSISFKTA